MLKVRLLGFGLALAIIAPRAGAASKTDGPTSPVKPQLVAGQSVDSAANRSSQTPSGPPRVLAQVNVINANPSNYAALVRNLKPGDTLLLEPGNYYDRSMPGLRLHDINGTVDAPITIMGDPTRPRPVLLGSSVVNTVRIANASHLVLKHLAIDSLGLGGDGIKAEGTAHHITLEDLVISGVGLDQSVVGISTNGGTTWDWVIRRNVIDGAGTGMYLGNSEGDMPFIGGLIEHNLVINSLGYNVQIKHQLAHQYPSLRRMPTGDRVTTIRHNVFSKSGNSAVGGNARPNLLVGAFPNTGPGSGDRYEIYGNFFYQNPTEALFQGEGNLAFHHNVLVNAAGDAITIQPHKGRVRAVRVFNNTIVASGRGIHISGGAPGDVQKAIGNAVFAATPISAPDQASNITDSFANAGRYLVDPSGALGQLDLYPKANALRGQAIDRSSLIIYRDWDRDFNGAIQDPSSRGAYAGVGANPGWRLKLEIKTSD